VQTERREIVPFQERDFVVVRHHGAALRRIQVKHVPAEELGVVIQTEQPEDGWRDVHGGGDRGNPDSGRDDLRAVEEDRDLVARHGNLGRSVNARTVVAHENEERVVEERVAAGVRYETAEREVGVLDGIDAPLLRGVGGDPAGRVEKRAMVRDRQDDRVEGGSGGVDRVHLPERPVEDRLVADSPRRPKRPLRKVGLLDYTLHPVRFHVPAHSVEDRAAAVDEERAVTARQKQLGQREEAARPLPPDDRDAGQRRKRRCRGLQRPDGPVAGRVGAGEESPLRDESVERRGQALTHLGVERPDELRAEALLQDEHDVGPPALPQRADVPEGGTRRERGEIRRALGEQPVQAPEVRLRAVRPVETLVGRVLASQRQPEGAVSVARELVHHAVGGNPGEVAGDREGQQRENRRVDGGKGDPTSPEVPSALRRSKESPKHQETGGGDEADAGEDETGVVALPDVAGDLRREEEVVHRDEVETPVELLEEEKLRGRDEERETERRRQAQGERCAHAPLLEPPPRHDREEENEGRREPEGCEQVEERPRCEGADDVAAAGGTRHARVDREHDSRDERRQPERRDGDRRRAPARGGDFFLLRHDLILPRSR
jgi:hypothetical protein